MTNVISINIYAASIIITTFEYSILKEKKIKNFN